jgi:hypothetical protein
MDLARRTTDLVSDSGEPVWGLNAFPQQDRIRGSERYFLVDAMGLDFMRNTYIAQYQTEEAIVSAFLSRQGSPEIARDTVALYLEHANRYGEEAMHITVDGLDMTLCDMGGSYDVVFQKGRLVAGVSAVEDQEMAIRVSVDLWKKLHNEEE